jgi:hypothetical protein
MCILLLQLLACTKDKGNNSPGIDIVSPEYKELFVLPDSISVSFNVNSPTSIEFIRINIDNKNLTPLSKNVFIYPDTNSYSNEVTISLDILPESIKLPPYYVHIAVSDYSKLHHEYLEIELKNSNLEFKGLIIIEDYSIDRMAIKLLDENLQVQHINEVDGRYAGSSISLETGLLYITSSTPELLRSFNTIDLDLEWAKNPQLPYPEYTGIVVENDMVYISSSVGRITGYKGSNGLQVFTTKVMPDTIPNNTSITKNYIVADYKLRNSSIISGWVTYYKITGEKLFVHPNEYSTVAMDFNTEINKVVIFCNDENNGYAITFDPETNTILKSTQISEIKISCMCKISNNEYLFSALNTVYTFNYNSDIITKLYDANNTITDLKYDNISDNLYVISPNEIKVFNYPNLDILTTIESENLIKKVEIMHGY